MLESCDDGGGAGEDAPDGGQAHRQLRTRRGNRPDRELRASLHNHDVVPAGKRAVASAGRVLIDGQVDALLSPYRSAIRPGSGNAESSPVSARASARSMPYQMSASDPGLATGSLMPAL
jgi:hypothetical protein